MLKPLDSHKPATSSTFLPHERPEVLRKLNEIEFSESDRLSDNYKDLDWFGFEAISIYERDDNIIGFSSIIHRPEYFAKKIGFEKAFISRCRSPRHLKKFMENVSTRTGTKWHMEDEKIAVCNPNFDECWQYKASTDLC